MIIAEKRIQEVEKIASESLDLMEIISDNAKIDIERKKKLSPESSLITANTWNGPAHNRFSDITNTNISALRKLIIEPFIARVSVISEDGQNEEYYITRSNTPITPPKPDIKFSNYNAPKGRLAAATLGDDVEIITPAGIEYYVVTERVSYHPVFEEKWDSKNNCIEKKDQKILTVESFRRFLDENRSLQEPVKDLLSELLRNKNLSTNIYEGTRKRIIHRMSLRDQPVLDKYQDDIFRLPIDSQMLIVGPPGSGKTTTLIRRLGQKVDMAFLSEEERAALDIVRDQTKIEHKNSWIMFTPTELLKQYLKEAFNREGIPASDSRIRTWEDYRHYLSRDILNILKSGTGSGSYILKNSTNILQPNILDDAIEWFQDFASYFKTNAIQILQDASDWLEKNLTQQNELSLLKQIQKSVDKKNDEIGVRDIVALNRINSDITINLNKNSELIKNKIDLKLNRLLNKDPKFLDEFATFTDSLISNLPEEYDESENTDIFHHSNHSKNRLQEAYNDYSRSMRTLARSTFEKNEINPNTKTGKILFWLEDRILDEANQKELGRLLNIQQRLRILSKPIKLFIGDVPRVYKKFRTINVQKAQWYVDDYVSNEINSFELDIIVLLMLMNINRLINASSHELIENSKFPMLKAITDEYRNQILVDEATDFSPIQLACMKELNHPKLPSFFACGDFNQRITNWGIKNEKQIKWVSARIEIRPISIGYRQSKELNNLAAKIASCKQNIQKINPDFINNDGFRPVLVENMNDIKSTSLWLKERVYEIESLVRSLPSIAIFVNSEEEITPLTNELATHLIEHNINVLGCPDGKVIGNDGAVRIFNIKHIKGLEFEAVFFVGVDSLAEKEPKLFDKYLYVGITRAATYLGITCMNKLPKSINYLKNDFIDKWRLPSDR
jgi:superfamily I DNA/RNA helicase